VPGHVFTVALTGGIASGKSLVSAEFEKLGVPVIDTDVIAHQIVEPGRPALKAIENTFGNLLIDHDGSLKRRRLREIIFSDPGARKKLESILHPEIRRQAGLAIVALKSDYCVLVIPLLAERGSYPDIDRVLVVDVPAKTRVSRLMARDRCTQQEAEQALASQATREQRLSIADDVLDNSGALDRLRDEVAQLHQEYTRLASNRQS